MKTIPMIRWLVHDPAGWHCLGKLAVVAGPCFRGSLAMTGYCHISPRKHANGETTSRLSAVKRGRAEPQRQADKASTMVFDFRKLRQPALQLTLIGRRQSSRSNQAFSAQRQNCS
jgi:hypothetical protein